MSGTKQLPSLKNLRPPYPDYRDRFFTDENNVALRVDDARHGFRHAAQGFAMVNAWWLAEAAGLGTLARVLNFFGSLTNRAAGLFDKSNPPRVRFVPGRLKDHVPLFYATHIRNAHVKG